jgi:protein SCO1/2
MTSNPRSLTTLTALAWLALLASLVPALVLTSCGSAEPSAPPSAPPSSAPESPPSTTRTGSDPTAEDPALADDLSLFQLELALEDQAERPFRLDALAGHPVLLTFFYARCDTMCPLILSDVRALETALPEGDREALRVVVVTIDPDDDAARLREVAAERGLPLDRWSLVRGDEAEVRTLASTVGMAYRRTPDGFAHNAILTVLDGRGVVVAQSLGTGQPLEPLVSAIAEVTAPSPR